jgi:hypothetical protein
MYRIEGTVCLSLGCCATLTKECRVDARLTSYPSVGGGRRCLKQEKGKRLHDEEVVVNRDDKYRSLNGMSSDLMCST